MKTIDLSIASVRDLNQALIFELGQAVFDARGAVEARNMAKLADLGFRFSIDKVQTLDLDFADLQRSDVKFIKVAADLMIEQLLDLDGGAPLRSMPLVEPIAFKLTVMREQRENRPASDGELIVGVLLSLLERRDDLLDAEAGLSSMLDRSAAEA